MTFRIEGGPKIRAALSRPRDLSLPVALLLALASGPLYGLVFPPFAHRFLGFVVLLPLTAAVLRVSPWRAFVCGLASGTLMTICVAPFLPNMIASFHETTRLVGDLFLLLAGVQAGAFIGMFAYAISWLHRRAPVNPLLIGTAWAVAEYGRTHFVLSNPFFLLGSSQWGTAFAQGADIAGVYGVSAMLATVAGCLALAKRRHIALAGMIIALAGAYGSFRGSRDYSSGPTVRVALVQPGITYDDSSFNMTSRAAVQRRLSALIDHAANDSHPALFILPEHSIDTDLGELSAGDRDLAVRVTHGRETLAGEVHHEGYGPTFRYFNSVALLRANRVADRYDKVRLLTFGEDGSLWIFGANIGKFKPGSTARPLATAAGKAGVMICSESAEPEMAGRLARNGAEFLANPTNDLWFGSDAGARSALEAAAMRAIETRRWIVRPSVTGYSAVIDPAGRIVASSAYGGAALLQASIAPSRARTLSTLLGAFAIAIFAGVIALAALRRSRHDPIRNHDVDAKATVR